MLDSSVTTTMKSKSFEGREKEGGVEGGVVERVGVEGRFR